MKKQADNKTGTPVEEKPISEKRKKVNKIVGIVVNILLILAIVLAAVCTYISYQSKSGSGVANIFGIVPARVLSDSMEPTFYEDDLVFDKAIGKNFDFTELRAKSDDYEGDIITFWTYIDGERVLNTHRITNIYDGDGHLIFETKGDNNTSTDYMNVHQNEVVGVYKFAWSGAGAVVGYLQEPVGFGLIILLPVFLFFVYHLIQFFRILFEYKNVKNRLEYEKERGRTEDVIEQQKEQSRAEIEAEIREKLRKEMEADASGKTEKAADAAAAVAPDADKPSEK